MDAINTKKQSVDKSSLFYSFWLLLVTFHKDFKRMIDQESKNRLLKEIISKYKMIAPMKVGYSSLSKIPLVKFA